MVSWRVLRPLGYLKLLTWGSLAVDGNLGPISSFVTPVGRPIEQLEVDRLAGPVAQIKLDLAPTVRTSRVTDGLRVVNMLSVDFAGQKPIAMLMMRDDRGEHCPLSSWEVDRSRQ